MKHTWDPTKRKWEADKEERIGMLEDRLRVCADALEFGLRFVRAAFGSDDTIHVSEDWIKELEGKFTDAIIEARRR